MGQKTAVQDLQRLQTGLKQLDQQMDASERQNPQSPDLIEPLDARLDGIKEELAESRRSLASKEQDLTQARLFVARTIHNINSPLSALKMLLTLLDDDFNAFDPGEMHSYISMFRKTTDQLINLTGMLRRIGRIQRNEEKFSPGPL
ncbi:MAG: hypothetical protein V1728_06215, partial [Candidatus Micrarchaeota archaeon]